MEASMNRLLTMFFFLVLALLVAVLGEPMYANTFAHSVRITQPNSEDPFDGRFNDGSGAAIRFVLADRADSVVIDIKLGTTVVRTLRATVFVSGDTLLIWDGNNNSGQPVGSGDYNVEITSYDQGYGSYTQLFYDQPAIFTRGVTAVRNQSARAFGFIYSADGAGGYVNNGIARHSADGRQWGDVEGNARLTSTGVPVGPSDVRFSSEADEDGFIYLLGRTNRQVFRYHADTVNVVMVDSGGYGTWFFNGLTVKTDGAGRRVALVASQASLGGTNSKVFAFTLSSPTAFHFGPKDTLLDGSDSFIFWDVQFGRGNTLYATFFARGDTVHKPGVAKFDLASWTGTPLTMADTIWTSRLDSGRTSTAVYWFGANPDGSQDILYFTNARIASGNPPSGQNIYGLTNLNAAQPTRAVAYADLQNNITTIRSDVTVDAVGNIVYFENSNEETVVISPPTGPNNFTTIAHPEIRVILSEPIAAVRIDANGDFIPDRLGDTVTVVGIVNGMNLTASANRFSYTIQDDGAGIVITKGSQTGGGPVYQVGDRLAATGRVTQFNGTAQIDVFGDLATNVILIDQGNPVVPIELTIRQRLADPELYESRLIKINYLIKKSGTWPASGTNQTLIIGDGVDSLAMFIDLDTDIDGTPEAVYPINVVGVATQFTTATPPNTGYQISPRFRTDFTENIAAPPNPLFALLTPVDGSVLQVDSATSYDFTWRTAVDVNNDPLIYQWKPVAFTGSLSNNAGADTIKTVTGATLLGYLGSADSLVFGWTALVKDPANPPVPSVDTFTVTLKRAGTPLPGFFDDFEAYTVGQRLACQNPTDWTTWSLLPCNTTEDPLISSTQAFSGTKSVVIALNNDLVKQLGGDTTGVHTMTFKMYIPTGKAGYFNTLGTFAGASSNWAMQVYFDVGGGGRIFAGSSTAGTFSYTYNIWHTVEVRADLDVDSGKFYFNGALIRSWRWTAGTFGGGGPRRLAANNFYGATANDEMYVDDYHAFDVIVGVDEDERLIPETFALMQNYPNPFNPTTTIRYALPQDALVTLKIYNILGQEVMTLRDEAQNVGYHEVVWNGRNAGGEAVSSGVYFYRIEARTADGSEAFTSLKKMLMLK